MQKLQQHLQEQLSNVINAFQIVAFIMFIVIHVANSNCSKKSNALHITSYFKRLKMSGNSILEMDNISSTVYAATSLSLSVSVDNGCRPKSCRGCLTGVGRMLISWGAWRDLTLFYAAVERVFFPGQFTDYTKLFYFSSINSKFQVVCKFPPLKSCHAVSLYLTLEMETFCFANDSFQEIQVEISNLCFTLKKN